jgi:hypothetical protein
MSEELLEERRAIRLAKNRFVILIFSSIIITLLLVSIAMIWYARSGAAQVDLSRPGYSGVRNQVSENQDSSTFQSSGPITKEVLDSYEELFNKTANQVTSVETFESQALSDETLRINDNPAPTSSQ